VKGEACLHPLFFILLFVRKGGGGGGREPLNSIILHLLRIKKGEEGRGNGSSPLLPSRSRRRKRRRKEKEGRFAPATFQSLHLRWQERGERGH